MRISKKFYQKHLVPLFAAIDETRPANRPMSTDKDYEKRLEQDLEGLEQRCKKIRTLAQDLQEHSHIARAAKKTKKRDAKKHAPLIIPVLTKKEAEEREREAATAQRANLEEKV